MTVRVLQGDCIEVMRGMEADSVHCCVTSPPYWGLRDYGVDGQYGMERTLAEHLDKMVEVFEEVRRVLHPEGTLWLNYGDCYATTPNGRSAADTKAAGNDDRTFRDKPFSTVGPVYQQDDSSRQQSRRGRSGNLGNGGVNGAGIPNGRIVAGGYLKPKDLCMIPNRLAIALQDAGWWVRSEIVWGKPNAMPDSSGRYRPATSHEKIFLLTKSGKSFYDPEAVRMNRTQDEDSNGYPGSSGDGVRRRTTKGNKVWKKPSGWADGGDHSAIAHNRPDKQRGHSRRHQGFNDRWNGMTKEEQQANGRLLRNYEDDLSPIVPPEVWRIATAAFKEAHFATFPVALVAPCIMAGCPKDGIVFDPFGGSGTVGVVADALGRDSVLIDLNADYCRMAIRRIRRSLGRVQSEIEASSEHGPLFAGAAQ